ncbi:MAG: hypothetical protein FWD61_17255 [Phycisphaerales bacterium]|nr:hypothetical protein [Phycisphaerales bacterium]
MKSQTLTAAAIGVAAMVGSAVPCAYSQAEVVTLRQGQGVVVVQGGAVTYEVDTQGIGFIRSVKVGDKTLVEGNKEPPLFASVLESAKYDGFSDFAPDAKVIPATYHLDKCTAEQKDNDVEVVTTGRLDWTGGDKILFEMHTILHVDGHVQVTVKAGREGVFKDRFLRDFGLKLPLALNERKRVVQASDRGIRFDTRFKYQFHTMVGFLETPDFNFWQHFWTDQNSSQDYHLWRSESLATSGLSEFRGRQSPGWTTVYDQQGGVLLSYKGMVEHAPKSLYIHATDHGTGVVYFHSPTHRAMALNDAAAGSQVFGMNHQMDWIFFKGEELQVKPDQMLGKIWGAQLASDGPERADEAFDKINLLDAKLTSGADAPLVVQGVPLPQGEVTRLDQVALTEDGGDVPLQTKALAYWPDGSIKWVLLMFPLDADKNFTVSVSAGQGRNVPLAVTLRTPEKRAVALKFGKDVKAGQTNSPLKATAAGETVQIDTGTLQLSLSKGERWLQEAKLNGHSLLKSDSKPMSFTDFVRLTGNSYSPNTRNIEGAADDGPLVVEKVELQEAGPLRAVVRLEGMTKSKEPMKVILRLEAYAGRSYVRMFHSVEFTQKDPRIVQMRKMGIHLPIDLAGGELKAVAGGQEGVVEIPDAAKSSRVGVTQNTPMYFDVWAQRGNEKYLTPVKQGNRSRGWLDASDSKGGVTVVVRNMWQEAPSEVVVKSTGENAGVDINLWPESGPVMDVRRYSNYGHMGQGESAGDAGKDNAFWAEKIYYGRPEREGFAGTSKTHELLLYFHGPGVSASSIDSLAADFQSPALVYAGAKWYADDTKVLLPTLLPGDSQRPMATANIDRGAEFLLFHQKYWNWYGFWDHGDIGHMFKRGYGSYIPGKTLENLLKMTPKERQSLKNAALKAIHDYWPQHDWAYDNGRWGWSNTEGLTGLFMQLAYLRTGQRDLYFFSEAAARQARDVVMRHNGGYFGYGTRHGVQHWSDGNHEQRQTINGEFRYNYLLSGDMRSAEFAQDLTDHFYMVAPANASADHSARLYGLLFAWERTHDAKYAETLKNYVHTLCQHEGIETSCVVIFPEGKRSDGAGLEKKGLNNGDMFFQYFGAMHALLEYYELTHDETLRQSMLQFASKTDSDIVGGKVSPVLAQGFAARYADNKDEARKKLAECLTANKGMIALTYGAWPQDRTHWTGPSAPVTHYPVTMFWLNAEGYVMGAFDKEPPLNPDQLKLLLQMGQYFGPLEKGQPTVQIPVQRESWQNEFDDPAIKSYTTPKRSLEP